jgi:hypothetical protein
VSSGSIYTTTNSAISPKEARLRAETEEGKEKGHNNGLAKKGQKPLKLVHQNSQPKTMISVRTYRTVTCTKTSHELPSPIKIIQGHLSMLSTAEADCMILRS